jgi:hypothetical protein
MATEADHIALANKNHDALLHLLPNVERFPEWVTVIAFYKAVQIIEAVFEHKYGRCGHGHQKRLEALKSRGYKELYRHYRVLWGASSVARYLYNTIDNKSYSSFASYLSAQQIHTAILKRRLAGIECEAVGMLSESCRNQLKRLPDVLPPPTIVV